MVIHHQVHEETRNHCFFIAFLRGLRDLRGKTIIMRCLHAVLKHRSSPDFLRTYTAEGKHTGIIDLLLVGDIDQYHLNDLSRKTEQYIKRKIRSLVLTSGEYAKFEKDLKIRPHILIWNKHEIKQSFEKN